MRIAIADNLGLKFDRELKEYWEKSHEVRYEMGANPALLEWADVYYVNVWDHNIHAMWSWVEDQKRCKKNAKVICRALDWEVWAGMARCPNVGKFVDECIAIAPHIKKMLEEENPSLKGKVTLIKPGINLDKFTFKKNFGSYNIIMPANDIDWYMKGTLGGLRIFKMLVDQNERPWHLTIKGTWTKPPIDRKNMEHFIEKAGIKDRVTFITEHVPDYNEFLEDFDYCLKPSLKEAFSFVSAECAAKGIMPVLNWWIGADATWPRSWLYLSPSEAVTRLMSTPYPKGYRDYVEKNYDVKRMCKEFDKLL